MYMYVYIFIYIKKLQKYNTAYVAYYSDAYSRLFSLREFEP